MAKGSSNLERRFDRRSFEVLKEKHNVAFTLLKAATRLRSRHQRIALQRRAIALMALELKQARYAAYAVEKALEEAISEGLTDHRRVACSGQCCDGVSPKRESDGTFTHRTGGVVGESTEQKRAPEDSGLRKRLATHLAHLWGKFPDCLT